MGLRSPTLEGIVLRRLCICLCLVVLATGCGEGHERNLGISSSGPEATVGAELSPAGEVAASTGRPEETSKSEETIDPEATPRPTGKHIKPARTPKVPTEAFPYTIQIAYPDKDGAEVEGSDVLVAVTVRGDFRIVDKRGKAAREGEGHIHFYLDVDEIPTDPNEVDYHDTHETRHMWLDVEPGEHTLAVQLVNNDHTALVPPVTDEIDVLVEE